MTIEALSPHNPLFLIGGIGALALLPLALLSCTSFLKLSVVFGILRNAIGAQSIPSGAIVTVLSLALTYHIMAPVVREAIEKTQATITQQPPAQSLSIESLIAVAKIASTPLEQFLRSHSGGRERTFFISVHGKEEAEDFGTLVPAFVISQLREAFMLGFMLYLPFLIIDLLVAHVLMALGMMMVSPATISLPIKLILFAASDGWLLLTKGLIVGYSS